MDIEQITAFLDTLSDEERSEWLSNLLAAYGEEDTLLQDQQARADTLRDSADPTMYNAGRFKIAASPLEHLGTGGMRYAGERMARDVGAARQGRMQRQQDARSALAEALMRRAPAATPPFAPRLGGRAF